MLWEGLRGISTNREGQVAGQGSFLDENKEVLSYIRAGGGVGLCLPCKRIFLVQRPGHQRGLDLLGNDLQPRILYLVKLPIKM